MKLQVGDIFVETNTGIVGLLVCKKEEHTYQYYIDWTGGTKGHVCCSYTKGQIQYCVDEKKLIHYPVVK